MDIQQAKGLKSNLEDDILRLILEFMQETDLWVQSIKYDKGIQIHAFSETPNYGYPGVDITVEIR
jgi:hypothetical protein